MIATENSQSLADFSQNPAETIDRLNQTGEPEVLTVDGIARVVLLSPAAYDELTGEKVTSQDIADIKLAQQQIAEGKFMEANAFFDKLHAELLEMQSKKAGSTE